MVVDRAAWGEVVMTGRGEARVDASRLPSLAASWCRRAIDEPLGLRHDAIEIALEEPVLRDAVLLELALGSARAISAVTFPASERIAWSVASRKRLRRVSQSCIVMGILRSAILSAASR